MSPKIQKERYTRINIDHLNQVIEIRKAKRKDLASAVGTVYENFARQIKKGILQKEWVEILCDELNVSREYLTDDNFNWMGYIPNRSDDFDSSEMQKSGLKTFMKFSRYNLDEEIEKMSDQTLNTISSFIAFTIDHPNESHQVVFKLFFNQ